MYVAGSFLDGNSALTLVYVRLHHVALTHIGVIKSWGTHKNVADIVCREQKYGLLV